MYANFDVCPNCLHLHVGVSGPEKTKGVLFHFLSSVSTVERLGAESTVLLSL